MAGRLLRRPRLLRPPRASRSSGIGGSDVERLRVLLIDDNPDDRALIRRELSQEYEPLEVEDVADAPSLERALRAGRFDIIITDFQLRFSTGLEILRETKARHPRIPVIMFTGQGGEEIAVEAMKSGFDDYVLKSPNLKRLTVSVRVALQRAREREALRESETRYRRLFEQVPLGLYRATASGEFIDVNPGLVQMLGYSHREPLLAARTGDLYVDPDERRRWEALMEREGVVRGFETRFKRKDGSLVWVEHNARAVRDASGTITYCEGTLEDVSERKRTEEALRSLEKAVENLPIGVTIADLDGRIVYTNPTEAKSHGYTVAELLGREARILVTQVEPQPQTSERVRDLKPWKRERTSVRKDGTTFPTQLFSDVITSATGKPIGIVTTSEDITQRKSVEEQLKKNAFCDSLTDLPNRALFIDRLGRALERSRRRREYRFAVLFLDLDRFKLVNDSFGHLMGDRLLVETARKLERCIRPSDTVSRLGGDEFAILAEEIRDVGDAITIAERSQRTLAAPLLLNGQELFTTASIGIAVGGPNYELPEDLLGDADTAMYQAKALGKGRFEIFDERMHARAKEVVRLEDDLRHALERGELRVVYQPIVSLKTGRLVSVEALLRWEHPQHGELESNEFVTLAEDIGLMAPIGEWALRTLCAQAKAWQDAGHALGASVNLSPRHLKQADLAGHIAEIVRASGLEPGRLELELTERAVMENVEESVRVLKEIKQVGVRVAIDDFGTGYSSLAHLKQLSVDTLKIDRSFVQQVTRDPRDAAIVSSVIVLGNSLGLRVVADGVETQEQLVFLRERGCDCAQGALLGEPMPTLPGPQEPERPA
jgi:Amt family ammonium transporter